MVIRVTVDLEVLSHLTPAQAHFLSVHGPALWIVCAYPQPVLKWPDQLITWLNSLPTGHLGCNIIYLPRITAIHLPLSYLCTWQCIQCIQYIYIPLSAIKLGIIYSYMLTLHSPYEEHNCFLHVHIPFTRSLNCPYSSANLQTYQGNVNAHLLIKIKE
jgi:hypothetical protein